MTRVDCSNRERPIATKVNSIFIVRDFYYLASRQIMFFKLSDLIILLKITDYDDVLSDFTDFVNTTIYENFFNLEF